jgi:hypothetical protein
MLTKTKEGGPTAIWESDDDGPKPFSKDVRFDGRIEVESRVPVTLAVTADQRKAWLAGQAIDLPLVTQELRYHAPGHESETDLDLILGLQMQRCLICPLLS